MPRIRTPHEGRHRLAPQIVEAGIKRSPEAGKNLPAPEAGIKRSPAAGHNLPSPTAGLRRSPVAGSRFPSPTL